MARLSSNFSNLLVLILAVPAVLNSLDTDISVNARPQATSMERRGLGSVLFQGAEEVGEEILNHFVNGGTTPAAAPAQQAPPAVPDNSAAPATTSDPSTDPNAAPASASPAVPDNSTTPATTSDPSTDPNAASAPVKRRGSTGGLPATGPDPTAGQLTSPPSAQRRSFASSAGRLIKGAEQVGKTILQQAAGGAINGAINGATNTISGGFPVAGPGLAAPPVQQTPSTIPDNSATPATTTDTGSSSTDPTTDAQTNPPIDPNTDPAASPPADPTDPNADTSTNSTASGNATEPASAKPTGINLTPPENANATAVINKSNGKSNKGAVDSAQRRRSGCVVRRSGPIGAKDFAACKREEIIRRAVESSTAARRAYALEELD